MESKTSKSPESVVREIKRKTRHKFNSEENLLIPAGSKGFKQMMSEFNSERCSNSAFCVGFAQGAYERTLKYCKERIQFDKPIPDFQGIRWTLAEMAIKIQAARLLIYDALIKSEKRGQIIAKKASMAKKYANDYMGV